MLNFKCFEMFPSGETFLEELPQINNLLHMYEVSISATGTVTHVYDGDDYTGHYLYRADGYPREINIPDLTSPPDYWKIAFVYKSL